MDHHLTRLSAAGSRVRTAWQALAAQTPAVPRPVGLDFQRLHLPAAVMTLDTDRWLLPPDLLRDSRSFAGVPLTASPHLDFARRVLVEPDLDHARTDYHRAAEHLTGRSDAARTWGPDQDCAEFAYLVKCLEKGWCEPCTRGPVVLAELRDGRHAILAGARIAAAAAALGRRSWEVQVAPENEVRAGVRQHLDRLQPHQFFRRNFALADALGCPPARLHPEAMQLAREIAAAPLVNHGDVYQPIPFPEFAGLASQADDRATYQRLGMILDLCGNPRGRRYLDLGCNLGFYVFSLARRGALASGLDLDSRFIDLAQRVAAIEGVPGEFVAGRLSPELFAPGGIFGAPRPVWDLVTCFSTLQWVVAEHGEDYAVAMLKAMRARCRALLLDVPVNCGNPRLRAAPGLEIYRLAGLIRSACGEARCKYVGTVAPYRVDRRHVFLCGGSD